MQLWYVGKWGQVKKVETLVDSRLAVQPWRVNYDKIGRYMRAADKVKHSSRVVMRLQSYLVCRDSRLGQNLKKKTLTNLKIDGSEFCNLLPWTVEAQVLRPGQWTVPSLGFFPDDDRINLKARIADYIWLR